MACALARAGARRAYRDGIYTALYTDSRAQASTRLSIAEVRERGNPPRLAWLLFAGRGRGRPSSVTCVVFCRWSPGRVCSADDARGAVEYCSWELELAELAELALARVTWFSDDLGVFNPFGLPN